MQKSFLLLCIALVYSWSDSSFAFQEKSEFHANSIASGITTAAETITKVLVGNQRESFKIDSFENRTAANLGPGLRRDLEQAFENLNKKRKLKNESPIKISNQSDTLLKGSLDVVDDPKDKGAVNDGLVQMIAVQVSLQLTDNSGRTLKEIVFFVNRIRDVAAASGLSLQLDLEEDNRKLHEQIRKEKENPSFVHNGTKIKNSPSSMISVEIGTKSALAKDSKAKPREPKQEESDFPFVPISIGEIYEVIVNNESEKEIAVALTIDGIDCFTFSDDRNESTGKPKFSHFIVPAGKTLPIPGWHRTASKDRDDNFASFLVTKYGDGASAMVPQKSEGNVGIITVAISHSFDPSSGKARGNAETGFGPPVKVNQKVITRKIDPPHEFISIRYNR